MANLGDSSPSIFSPAGQLADISIHNSEETWPAKTTLIHLLQTLAWVIQFTLCILPSHPPHTQKNGMFCHVESKLGSPLKSLSDLHCQFYAAQNIPPYFFQAHIILFCPFQPFHFLPFLPTSISIFLHSPPFLSFSVCFLFYNSTIYQLLARQGYPSLSSHSL